MGFPTPLSGAQLTTLRASGYWQRTLCAINPSEIVMQAQANETISTNPFIEFQFDNVTVGSAADVWAGFVYYISTTPDFRTFKYRGRVSREPVSTTFYTSETAVVLNEDDYITVVRDADYFAKTRRDTLVDGYQTYQNLEPQIEDLPSVVVLYDVTNAGVMQWTPVQIGVPVAFGASIDDMTGWEWAISGSGTASIVIGSSTDQHPTFEFEVNNFYIVRSIVTDSNGVPHFQFVKVWAIGRTFGAPALPSWVSGTISHDLDAGFTGDITGYADASTLQDRTDAVVFMVQRFGDNSSTPIVTNVLMHGRIRSDSIQTQGSTEAGQIQQVTFTVEGVASYMGRLRIPPDIVRNVAVPDEWGEMVDPTTYRMACYVLTAYTTVSNLCSFTAGNGAFEDWLLGGQPVALDGGFTLDILNGIFWDRLKVSLNYAPDGNIHAEINNSFQADRSGLTQITTFALRDLREFEAQRDSSLVTAQAVAYAGMYNSTTNQFILFTSQSPSIVYGDAPETKETTRELLVSNSATSVAEAEVGLRAGNFWAFENPKTLVNVVLYDSYVWLIATNYQRWAFDVPASANTLGIDFTANDYFLLQAVNLTINGDGSIEVGASFYAETEFDDFQQLNALLPSNLENLNPVLPVLPNDPAFPIDPLELYPSDTPGIDDLQPIDNFSAGQSWTPFPPDIAAEMSANQGTSNCFPLAVNFRNPNNTSSVKTTALGDDYLLSLKGDAQINDDVWVQDINFGGSLQGFTIVTPFGTQVPGQGIDTGDGVSGGIAGIRSAFVERVIASSALTSITATFDLVKGTFDAVTPVAIIFINGVIQASVNPADITDGNNKTLVWSGSLSGVTDISVQIVCSYDNVLPYTFSGSALLKRLSLTGTGTNPFTGTPGGLLRGDAFYFYQADDETGATAQLYGSAEGLRLDNAAVNPAIIPPYNANHSYQIAFTGTNNLLLARMQFDDYAPKQNRNLMLEMCKV